MRSSSAKQNKLPEHSCLSMKLVDSPSNRLHIATHNTNRRRCSFAKQLRSCNARAPKLLMDGRNARTPTRPFGRCDWPCCSRQHYIGHRPPLPTTSALLANRVDPDQHVRTQRIYLLAMASRHPKNIWTTRWPTECKVAQTSYRRRVVQNMAPAAQSSENIDVHCALTVHAIHDGRPILRSSLL